LKRIVFYLTVCLFYSANSYAQNPWTQKANFPGGPRAFTSAFTIGHYAFVGLGYNGSYLYDFSKWNETTNTWSSIPNYPGAGSYNATAFTIEGKGYVCLGLNGSGTTTDMWRYDTITNAWTQMATFPGIKRYDCEAFVIGHKAYLVAGSISGPPYLQDVWVYDAHQNTWTQKANWPGGQVEEVIIFAIGNHGYVGDGWYPGCTQQMFEYDTTNDSWTSIAAPPPAIGITEQPDTWVAGSKAYVCTGGNCNAAGLRYGWMYDTVTKSWCEFNDISASKLSRGNGVVFTINNHGYFCTGQDTNLRYLDDLWEYTPSTKIKVSDTNLCATDSVSFSDSTTYIASAWDWSFPGGTPASSHSQNPKVYYSHAGTYTATLMLNACGGDDTVIRTISVIGGTLNNPIQGNSSVCSGGMDILTATGGTTYLWSNGATTSSITVSPSATTTYSVHISSGCGNEDTNFTVHVDSSAVFPTIIGSDTICSGFPDILTATGGESYLWSTGSTAATITVFPSSTTTYSVKVTNECGSASADATVFVAPAPVSLFTSDIRTGCAPLCIQYRDLSTLPEEKITMWRWAFGNGDTLNEENPIYCYHDTGTFSTSLTTVSNNGCSSTLKIANMITVFRKPIANFIYTPQPVDIMEPTVQFADESTDIYGISYRWWSFGDGVDTAGVDAQTPKHSYMDTGIYCPELIVENARGCLDTVTNCLFVEPLYTLYIPSAFSPNGDGLNDIFAAKGTYIKSFEMYVFDRWGMELFHSNSISQGWDGTIKGGNVISQEDSYVYKITVTDWGNTQHYYIGEVTLLK